MVLRVALSLGLIAASALQPGAARGATIGIEARSDHRWRGLSWADGRPTLAARISAPVGSVTIDAGIAATRGSARHAGAQAAIDLGLHYTRALGAWRVSGGATAYLFPGESGLDFVEVDAGGGLLVGPAQMDVTLAYAPPQAAIGGDNLYVSAGMAVAVPGTPLTVVAGLGHSTGSGDDRAHARRLRPAGDYSDGWLGIDRVRGPLRLGLRYTATRGAQCVRGQAFCDRHTGDRLTAQASITF